MIAFHDIKAEMREAIPAITTPCSEPGARPACRVRGHAREETDSPIDPWMEAAFEGLTHASETGDPFALVPCFMNGKPAVIIAALRSFGRKLHVTPLFLACQPWMQFSETPGDGSEEDGGGPDHAATGEPPAPR